MTVPRHGRAPRRNFQPTADMSPEGRSGPERGVVPLAKQSDELNGGIEIRQILLCFQGDSEKVAKFDPFSINGFPAAGADLAAVHGRPAGRPFLFHAHRRAGRG